MPSSYLPTVSRHVAVIGAGPAGVVAARELRREGHEVVVFEKDNQVGGTFVYTHEVESDLLGLDPNRSIVHSSLYESLRTNLPRELMGFIDYPFVAREGKQRDQRRFPGHREVVMYLQEFARDFRIEEMVRFGAEVVNVEIDDNGKWKVKSQKKRGLESGDYCDNFDDCFVEEGFDAVVVCNGHYTEPNIAEIPGINLWPGKQIHSHNYRTPELFKDQVVILIGGSHSAIDISSEIAEVAKEVHIAARSVGDNTYAKQPGYDNIWLHPMLESANEDGTVVFPDGSVIPADIILHCTGYKYNFPFLKTNGILTVDDNRVGPLYKHVFPPALAPSLSFVGIPWKSKWIAGVLSGRIMLPSPEEMMEDVNSFYLKLEASGMPKRYTHKLDHSQLDYSNWLGAQCGCAGFEEWRVEMYYAAASNRIIRPKTHRDEWDDNHLIMQACEHFKKVHLR